MKSVRVAGLLLVLLLTGCGGPKRYPVEGVVLWSDGKPAVELIGGTVNFESADGKTSAMGPIEAHARYRLGTDRTNDGVLAGKYKVVLSEPPSADADRPRGHILHPNYMRLNLTKLEVTVEETGNDLPLKVERARR